MNATMAARSASVDCERRHALVGTPGAHDGADLVAANVLGHERRTGEIGAAFAAGRVAAVAEAALRSEHSLAGLDLFGWVGLRRDGLWRTL